MDRKAPKGVGFLLFFIDENGVPRLYTIKELNDKPQYSKCSGMVSFPIETFEEKDVNPQGTIRRLLREEMGILENEVIFFDIAQEVFHPIPGREDIDIFYGYGLFSGNSGKIFVPGDVDIVFAGWKTLEELLAQYIRVEVRPILEHFKNNHSEQLFGKLN